MRYELMVLASRLG